MRDKLELEDFCSKGHAPWMREMIDAQFWKDRRVFITGHTGFKGAWLVLLFEKQLGAEVTGFSLAPPTSPSLFGSGTRRYPMPVGHGEIFGTGITYKIHC